MRLFALYSLTLCVRGLARPIFGRLRMPVKSGLHGELEMSNNRRTFLKQASGVAAATFLDLESSPEAYAAPAETIQSFDGQKGWYSHPMRWAQLAFVENDPGNYDKNFWLDYFQEVHADAACLSAGGVVAFYPTEVPLHYRSKWLGDRDTFGDLLAGCRKLKMNVVARTDSHACRQNVYDAHPDWIMVDEKGNKVRHPSDPDLWLTCALGPYSFEFMTAVHHEIMVKYRPDSIFTNRWSGSGICYCEHCQKNFHEFSGFAIPRTTDPQDPARKQYILWNQQRLFELWGVWNKTIKEVDPDASYIIANASAGGALEMKTIGEMAPTLFADKQSRRGMMPPWFNGKNGKEYRSVMGDKPIVGIFSVGLDDKNRWKDSVQSPDEIKLWVADGLAQGLRPWFTKFNGKIIDRRWLPVVKEIYQWQYENEHYLRNVRPLAQVGMVYSQHTTWFYGGDHVHDREEDPTFGYYHALVEARIPFEMVSDQLLDRDHLAQFKTLILPNIAALSDAQCKQIADFVERGGGIVATFETSLYDEWGVRRKDFGLADLFGASFGGKVEVGMLNSYLTLEKDPNSGQYHPLLKGFEDAVRIINATSQVDVVPKGDSLSPPLRIVPSYPDLPMESVYMRPGASHHPGVYVRRVGAGRVVYFPGDIDRTFWEVLDMDHGNLLRNAVLWTMAEAPQLEVKGKGIVDVSFWEQKDSVTVHLVNLTNPMMMKGPVREVIPIRARRSVCSFPPDGR